MLLNNIAYFNELEQTIIKKKGELEQLENRLRDYYTALGEKKAEARM